MTNPELSKQIIDQIKNLLHLKNLDDDLLVEVTYKALATGQTLFFQGAPASHTFFILRGNLKISSRNETAESILAILSQGDFGGALLMTKEHSVYPGAIQALMNSMVVLIPKKTFVTSWLNHPDISDQIKQCIQKRILNLQSEKLLQNTDVNTRLAHFLIRHYVELKDLVGKKVTRKEIALAIGSKTETVIRALKKLELEGIVQLDRSLISVCKPEILRDFLKFKKL